MPDEGGEDQKLKAIMGSTDMGMQGEKQLSTLWWEQLFARAAGRFASPMNPLFTVGSFGHQK